MDYNITQFLTSGEEILICSDFEGVLPKKQMDYFESVFTGKTIDGDADFKAKRIIYLGDIFDNTGTCPEKDNGSYCSLKTLKYLVANPDKSKYVVGNRDINKIKLFSLLQCKDNIRWWKLKSELIPSERNTISTVTLPETDNIYVDIVSQLMIDIFNSNNKFWNITSMKNYIPFWSAKKEIANWFSPPVGSGINIKEITTLHNRFQRIFGGDPAEGTMSAEKTLNGIPNELFPSNIIDVIQKIKDNIQTIVPTTDKNIDNEIRSGIVFTLYMRMLDEDLYIKYERNKNPITFPLNKKGDLEGYLWKLLTTAAPALYAQINHTTDSDENNMVNDLLLFSHGGISNEFSQTVNKLKGIQKLESMDWNKVLIGHERQQKPDDPVSVSIDVQREKPKDIIGNITSYNDEYFRLLKEFFNKFKSLQLSNYIDESQMILLSISAPAEHSKYIYDQGYDTSDLSPIQPRLPADSVLTQNSNSNQRIFNFCGHGSSGNGYGLKKITDNMFLINTDLTASIFNTSVCSKTYNSNYLFLTIKYNTSKQYFDFLLKGHNVLSKDKFIVLPTAAKEKDFPVGDTLESIITAKKQLNKKYAVVLIDGKYTVINSDITLDIKYDGILGGIEESSNMLFKDNYIGKEFFIFNGVVTYNGKVYDLYSFYRIIAPTVKKNILILDSIKSQEEPRRSVLDLRRQFESHSVVGGYRKNLSSYKSIKKNRKYKTKGKLFKKNSTRNKNLKSKKH